jgi:hypothetical protein
MSSRNRMLELGAAALLLMAVSVPIAGYLRMREREAFTTQAASGSCDGRSDAS